jgi:hypothetical protein
MVRVRTCVLYYVSVWLMIWYGWNHAESQYNTYVRVRMYVLVLYYIHWNCYHCQLFEGVGVRRRKLGSSHIAFYIRKYRLKSELMYSGSFIRAVEIEYWLDCHANLLCAVYILFCVLYRLMCSIYVAYHRRKKHIFEWLRKNCLILWPRKIQVQRFIFI